MWLSFLNSRHFIGSQSIRVRHAALGGFIVRAQSSAGRFFVRVLSCGEQNSLRQFCVRRLKVSVFVFGLWFEAFLEIVKVPFKVMGPVFEAFNFGLPVSLFVYLASHHHPYFMYHGKGGLVSQ